MNGAEFSPATQSRFFSRLSNHEKAPLKCGRVSPRLFVQRFELFDADESEGDQVGNRQRCTDRSSASAAIKSGLPVRRILRRVVSESRRKSCLHERQAKSPRKTDKRIL